MFPGDRRLHNRLHCLPLPGLLPCPTGALLYMYTMKQCMYTPLVLWLHLFCAL
jgi:hypothetical protein